MLLSANHYIHVNNNYMTFSHPWSNTMFRFNRLNDDIEELRHENYELLNAKTIKIMDDLYAVLAAQGNKSDMTVWKYEKV